MKVVFLVDPVLMTELAIINRLSLHILHKLRIQESRVIQILEVIVHRCRVNKFFNNATLIKEIVLLAANNHMENEVNDKEHGSPVEARWVHLGSCASRAEPWNEGQAKRE